MIYYPADDVSTPPRLADLKEVPLEKPDGQELHPDVQGEDPPPPFHNYLDEFLQAIRVFGFLEKPVCLAVFLLLLLLLVFVYLLYGLRLP